MIASRYDSGKAAGQEAGRLRASGGRGALSAAGLGFVAWVGLVAGCQGPVAGSLEVVPTRFTGASLVAVASGDPVELVRPIQGGHVLFIGALVRGAVGSRGTIRGELRRGESATGEPLAAPGAILVFEERSTKLVELAASLAAPSPEPGWQQVRADIGDVANIPACPNFLPVELPEHKLYVQVVYTDEKGNTGTASRLVMPRCTQTDPSARSLCLCECHASYTIDRCFQSSDAGATD